MGWQQLVFCIPLAAGVLLATGAAFHHAHDVWLPRVMFGCLIFGGVGMVLQALPFAVAASVAGVATLALTRRTQRLLPSSETYLLSRHDFAGCTGTLLLPADAASGYAQIKDPEGNVHNLRCRAVKGALEKGTSILVIQYDERTQTYLVDANPLEGGTSW